MADYSIYVLQEDDITLSDGAILDGVSQGDGTHLVNPSDPITITLNNRNWIEAEITDTDTDFRDNDGAQELRTDLTLNGVTFSAGDVAEAEYAFTVTNGAEIWTLVAFNIRDSSPPYATVEAVAFIGPPGGFPPTGEPLEITSAIEFPDFESAEYATPICFAAGTRIEVPGGTRAVENIQRGDLVKTLDHGAEVVRWIGRRTVQAHGRFAPIVFAPGTIGNTRELRVSQQHRIEVRGAQAELMFGHSAVLAPAKAFLGQPGVRRAEGGMVTYVHIMFDGHRLLRAEGAVTESFYPGPAGLSTLEDDVRAELFELFPELKAGPERYGPMVHPPLSTREAAALLSAD